MKKLRFIRRHEDFKGHQLKAGQLRGLTVHPEPVEGWTVKPFMVRQAYHERLKLKLSRLKLVANLKNPFLKSGKGFKH